MPSDSPLWVMLELRVGKVPALVDTGAQLSCIRSDVVEYLYLLGEPCKFLQCAVLCTLADGTRCKVTKAAKLHLNVLKFAWDHEFKILNGGTFPLILGLDFLNRTQMVLYVSAKKYSFRFAPDCSGEFSCSVGNQEGESYLQTLTQEASKWPGEVGSASILVEFPAVFSSALGTADCVLYEIELSDPTPVCSSPY